MIDPRITRLADVLVSHSTRLTPGEHVLIETFDAPDAVAIELVKAAHRVGAHPHVAVRRNRIARALLEAGADAQFETWSAYDKGRMERMDAYIAIRGSDNVSELAGIDAERMQSYGKLYQKPVHLEQRVKNTKWCVLRWPSPSMAQLAQMNTAAFEDFYFNVCTLDYQRMADAVQPLKSRMERTDEVRIAGPGETDITFSIKDIPVVPCTGSHNIPDGECFTSPVRDSVNGVMHYNTPTIYRGITFENIKLTFRNGQIVDATADQNGELLKDIFDTDDGARYVGEFAIGFNPF
ncbi:MAG: aminopeptidase, partial [Planctomycetota bacterium]